MLLVNINIETLSKLDNEEAKKVIITQNKFDEEKTYAHEIIWTSYRETNELANHFQTIPQYIHKYSIFTLNWMRKKRAKQKNNKNNHRKSHRISKIRSSSVCGKQRKRQTHKETTYTSTRINIFFFLFGLYTRKLEKRKRI